MRPNLAVSLNAPNDEIRDEIMPINRKWNIAQLLDALRAYPLEQRRRITFEYVLLAGVNDSLDDARQLAQLLRGIQCKVNIIPWNPHPRRRTSGPPTSAVDAFQNECKRLGLPPTCARRAATTSTPRAASSPPRRRAQQRQGHSSDLTAAWGANRADNQDLPATNCLKPADLRVVCRLLMPREREHHSEHSTIHFTPRCRPAHGRRLPAGPALRLRRDGRESPASWAPTNGASTRPGAWSRPTTGSPSLQPARCRSQKDGVVTFGRLCGIVAERDENGANKAVQYYTPNRSEIEAAAK